VFQNVHVNGESRKKRVLLGVAQLLARAEDLRLGLTDGIERAVAVEDGLARLNTIASRLDIDHCAAGDAAVGPADTRLGAFDADIAGRLDGREVSGVRLRNVLV